MSDIKVHAGTWSKLDPQHQSEVQDILAESGLLAEGGKISADPNAAAPTASKGLGSGFCSIICDLSGQFGHAQCLRLPPIAQPACNAAVDAGVALCKKKCK